MIVSARSALLVLVGLIPLAFAPSRAFAWGWFGIIVATCVLDALGAPSPRTLRLRREVTGPIRADQTTTATLRLSNTTKRRMSLDVRDAWPPSLRPSPPRRRVHIGARGAEKITTTLSPTRRGTRHADLVTIRSWGPLHLGARQVSIAAPLTLSVLPEFKARVLLPSRLARLHELEGTTPTTLRGAGTEFDSLRAYVLGDDPRDIDWRASARALELMVRQWRPERDRHVVIVVDCGRAASALLGAPERMEVDSIALGCAPRLDSSIETAFLLAALADRAGDKVHVLAADSHVRARVSGVRGPKIIETLAHTFTDISARLDVTDWSQVAATVEQTVHHSAFVVIATKIPPAGMETEFTDALSRLTERHTVLVASATDPDELRARRGRADAEEVFLAASAALSQRADEAGAADVRLAGALTLQASADLLPARTADRYIELKKSGRL